MASSQEDTSSGFSLANDMARSRGTENAVLSDQELLDSVSCPNLGNQLNDLGVVVSSIPTDDKKASFDAFGD